MIGWVLFIIWFLIFMIGMIWVNTYVVENNKNFVWTFVYAFSYLGLSCIIFKLIGG